jgi:adhesin transport system outer membrane protein
MKYLCFSAALAAGSGPYCHAQALPEQDNAALMSNYSPDLGVLRNMVLVALERSPQVREAQASTRAAQMDTLEAKGARWPRLDASAASRSANLGGSADASGQSTGTGRIGLTATYNLYDAGRTAGEIGSREFTEQAATARIALTRETVAFDTVNAYLQIIKQQRIIDLYKAHIERLSTLETKLAQIVGSFPGRRSELTQANARLGQAREAMDSAFAKQRENRLSLTRLLGSDALIPRTAQPIPQFEPLSASDAIPTALERHPQLLASLAEIQSLKETVNVTSASRLPHIDVEATKVTGTDVTGNSTPAQIYLAARWNLFQGFAGQAATRAAIERSSSAQERYEQFRIEIDYKIRSAWEEYLTHANRLKTLPSLAMATDQVRKDYYVQWNDLARRSLLEVLTAENDHLSTLLSLTSSDVDQQIALARVRFEAGALAQWMVGTH